MKLSSGSNVRRQFFISSHLLIKLLTIFKSPPPLPYVSSASTSSSPRYPLVSVGYGDLGSCPLGQPWVTKKKNHDAFCLGNELNWRSITRLKFMQMLWKCSISAWNDLLVIEKSILNIKPSRRWWKDKYFPWGVEKDISRLYACRISHLPIQEVFHMNI